MVKIVENEITITALKGTFIIKGIGDGGCWGRILGDELLCCLASSYY